jgi:spectinomycin phosphotransferase
MAVRSSLDSMMFDRPPVSDEVLIAVAAREYGITAMHRRSLGGEDVAAWTYRAEGLAGQPLFVKVSTRIDLSRLAACRWLLDDGVGEVVAPVQTRSGALSAAVDGVSVVAYPFVDGRPAAEAGLTERQWVAYGRMLRRLHDARLPAELGAALPREAFTPVSLSVMERVEAAIGRLEHGGVDGDAGDPIATSVVTLWREHGREVDAIGARTATLAERLRMRLAAEGDRDFVACHADVHTYNVLVDDTGALRVVDWDELLIAPPERDLMFILGSPIGLPLGEREVTLFADGYGALDVDPGRLAYYHSDWAVQDVAGYAEQALSAVLGRQSREHALRILRGLFESGGEVDVALGAGSGEATPQAHD